MRKYDTLKDTFVLVALFRWNQWALHVSSVINNKQEKSQIFHYQNLLSPPVFPPHLFWIACLDLSWFNIWEIYRKEHAFDLTC